MIQAAINQVKNSDIFTLNALADAILPMVQTNLTKAEITRLMLEVPAFLSEGSKMEQMTIPTYETCWNLSLIHICFAACYIDFVCLARSVCSRVAKSLNQRYDAGICTSFQCVGQKQ